MRGKQREDINSSPLASFISLSKGNAFIDVIIGGMDEMIKMEINCCFEQREREMSTGKQEGLVWEERSVFEYCGCAAGERI